jgi:hypothetical protein
MRKLHISIGLSLLLLLAQQGAVLHEVGHISRVVAGSQATVDVDRGLARTCELCLAFSQVANPAGNPVNVPWFEPSSCAAGFRPSCAVIPGDIPTPRSRGPPSSRSSV